MDKNETYRMLAKQVESLIEGENNPTGQLANAAALLWETLADINWAGFYIVRNGNLVLGPFQGNTACIHIAKGRGVCGTAWETDAPQLVPDVHQFPGHIACDSASNSEIVIPIHAAGNVRAVLDLDSPLLERFSQEDLRGLCSFVEVLEEYLKWE